MDRRLSGVFRAQVPVQALGLGNKIIIYSRTETDKTEGANEGE